MDFSIALDVSGVARDHGEVGKGRNSMAKRFSERPRWQRWGIIGGWGVLALVVLVIVLGESAPETGGSSLPAAASADLAGYRKSFARLALPCEAAQMKVGAGLQEIASADRVELASAVQAMEGACGNAWMAIDELQRPAGLSDGQVRQLDAMTKECETAFYLRKELAGALVPVVDGDMRPSAIAGIKADMAEMQRASDVCSAALKAVFPDAAPSPGAQP